MTFLFVLSTDDSEKATRCFQLAKIAYTKGYIVNLFLVDDGVRLADKAGGYLQERTVTGDCPGDYLPYLVKNEVPIGV